MRIIHRKGERITVELDDMASAMVREFMAKGHECFAPEAGRDPRDVVSAAVTFLLGDPNTSPWDSSDDCLELARERRDALEQGEAP